MKANLTFQFALTDPVDEHLLEIVIAAGAVAIAAPKDYLELHSPADVLNIRPNEPYELGQLESMYEAAKRHLKAMEKGEPFVKSPEKWDELKGKMELAEEWLHSAVLRAQALTLALDEGAARIGAHSPEEVAKGQCYDTEALTSIAEAKASRERGEAIEANAAAVDDSQL